MRLIKTLALIAVLFSGSNITFSQTVIKETGFAVKYYPTQLQLQFDANQFPQNITVSDARTAATIVITQDAERSYKLTQLHPSQIVKVNYQTVEAGQTIAHTKYLATPSTSSGEIKVWFNHEVNTAYSQGHDAVNLSNTLDDKLISYINACQSTLDIAIYNSSSPSSTTGIAGAINAAYTRGVQVRVVYDGSTGSTMIPLLNAAIPRIASPNTSSYGIMHNKFVIFDADNTDANVPLVWTGSTNWTVAQIDGPDRNSVILIQDQTLAQAYKIEFEEMFGSSTMTPDPVVSKFGPFKTDNTPHHFIIGGKEIDSYFSPTDGANAQIISAINSADSDIDIATMLITRSDIRDALINKFNGGMTNVNLVVDTQNPASNQYTNLVAALSPGHVVKFTDAGIMHHKFMVVDNFNAASDPLVTVGSHNWSSAAETKNDENMLVVHDAAVADQYYQAFAYLYGLAGGILPALSTTSPESNGGFIISPNPSTGMFTLENKTGMPLENASITVFDMMGKAVFTNTNPALTTTTIDLSNQAAGMYFIEMQSAGKTMHYKLMKN